MTDASASLYVHALGGVAVLALGALALVVRPRTRASLAFATFAVGFGGYYAVNNTFPRVLHASEDLTFWTYVLMRLVSVAGLVAMALVFPAPIARRERRMLLLGVAVAAPLAAASFAASVRAGFASVAEVVADVTGALAVPALYGFVALLAARFLASDDAQFRRQVALTAAALTIVVAFSAAYGGNDGGETSPLHAEGPMLVYSGLRLAVVLGLAGAWLVGTHGPDALIARRLAWLTLGTALVGLALAAPRVDVGGFGVARLLMTAVLAYAVLQHQLLGLDVKVRWTISKSTVAALFIAVFFVASEGAQILFGAGNEWVGLVAAGALVFAITPLQRAAERLAEKAVPVAHASPAADAAQGAEADYHAAVRLALRDGALSKEEERVLLRLAERAGIPTSRALAIHEELEREVVP